MSKTKTVDSNKVGVGKFWAWQSRGVSLAAITLVMGYLTIFCTDTLGMAPGVVGTILMVSKVFDGVSDFIACYVIDNTHTKWGKGRPYEWCILGCWICTMALFYTPPTWSETVKIVWVFVMYTLIFSVFSTLLNANQTPYMIRAFDNNQQKITKIGALGGIVIMLGAMIVSISFPVLMGKMAVNSQGWRSLITIYALPLALIGMLRFIFVKEDPTIDEVAGNSKVSIKDILHCLKKNKYAWFIAGITGCYNITVGMNVGSYYFTYIVGDVSLMGMISILSVVTLPVMFVFPKLMEKLSASKMIFSFAWIGVVGYLTLFIAQANFPLLVIGTILMGIGQFPVAYLQANIGMQLADYNEYIGLPRMDGSVGVLGGAFSKVGAGIGSGLLGILLGAAGYVGSIEGVDGVVTQSAGALMMIRCLYSIIPMMCIIFMAFFASRMFSLDKMSDEIETSLTNKRKRAKNI